jgi:hypothetical protein
MISAMGDGERFIRVVGRRAAPPALEVPSPARRAALDALQPARTRVPKGVFRYRSHEDANADRERWTVDAMVARAR